MLKANKSPQQKQHRTAPTAAVMQAAIIAAAVMVVVVSVAIPSAALASLPVAIALISNQEKISKRHVQRKLNAKNRKWHRQRNLWLALKKRLANHVAAVVVVVEIAVLAVIKIWLRTQYKVHWLLMKL